MNVASHKLVNRFVDSHVNRSEDELWPAVYYFYILRSLKNNKLYLGSTPDLKERIKSHNKGENKATKPNIPYELIFYSAFKNKTDAINCEKYFKSTAGWKRLHRMLKNYLKITSET